jgi:signal transduction histidine kinase
VQEALTNVVKHARGAAVRVALRREQGCVEVEVADTGSGRAPARDKPGHGLVGMRERVALYGGALDAGPLPGGGFRVGARFPLTGPSGGRAGTSPAPE